jgi:hypothetical protein
MKVVVVVDWTMAGSPVQGGRQSVVVISGGGQLGARGQGDTNQGSQAGA